MKEILESNTKPNFRTYSCLMIDCTKGDRYSDCNPEKCIKEIKTWRRQRQNLINGRIFHEKHLAKINKLLAGQDSSTYSIHIGGITIWWHLKRSQNLIGDIIVGDTVLTTVLNHRKDKALLKELNRLVSEENEQLKTQIMLLKQVISDKSRTKCQQ